MAVGPKIVAPSAPFDATGSAITEAIEVDSESLNDGSESAAVRRPPARSPVPVASVSRPVESSVAPVASSVAPLAS